ncbi:MAG: sigma-70 family RNA polymerase sigma factor [Bacteroidia bacterium]|nr:sigma-70 family RNA polymerase sigma factor [Bacteroidia bacterium]
MSNKFHISINLINKNNNLVCTAYNLYAVQLAFIAYKYLKNEDESKDIVMDLFEKLLKTPKEDLLLKGPIKGDKFKSWLFLVLKNMCLDTIKHKNIIQKYIAENPNDENYSFSESERRWDKQTIEYVLNQLGECEYRVIKMHLDGFSNDEISKTYNLSYNTVRNQISIAKKKMRSFILSNDNLVG